MSRLVVMVSALMLGASPAVAQMPPVTDAPEARQVPSTDATDLNRIVCKKQETIGSRLGAKKVCLTVQEWNARAAEDRDELGKIQRQTQNGGPVG